MRKNKSIKKQMENDCGLKLRELCEVLNPPEYRRKDFLVGQTISEAAGSIGKLPNFIFNEMRLKKLKPTLIRGRVRISRQDFINWLALGENQSSEVRTDEN